VAVNVCAVDPSCHRNVEPALPASSTKLFTAQRAVSFPSFTVGGANTTTAAKQPAGAAGSSSTPAVTLRFFPEGGDLVAGAESLLAFKATDQSGKPVKITGLRTIKKGGSTCLIQKSNTSLSINQLIQFIQSWR